MYFRSTGLGKTQLSGKVVEMKRQLVGIGCPSFVGRDNYEVQRLRVHL